MHNLTVTFFRCDSLMYRDSLLIQNKVSLEEFPAGNVLWNTHLFHSVMVCHQRHVLLCLLLRYLLSHLCSWIWNSWLWNVQWAKLPLHHCFYNILLRAFLLSSGPCFSTKMQSCVIAVEPVENRHSDRKTCPSTDFEKAFTFSPDWALTAAL